MKKTNQKHNKARKIYNIISSIIVTFVFIFLLASVIIIVVGKTSGGDMEIGGKYVFDVISDSMTPTIKVNQSILCEKVTNPETLKEKDIITFIAPSGQAKGYNITHRIKHIERNTDGTIKYIKTQGDKPGAPVDDWELKPSEVKARFIKIIPGLGEFRQFLLTPVGYIVMIFIPLLTVGILFIISFIKDRTERLYEKENKGKKVEIDDLSDDEKKKLLEEFKNNEKKD